MPLIWAIGGILLQIVGSVVGRALLALGMGFVTFQGFDLAIGWLLTQIKANMAALPTQALSLLAYLWVDKAFGLLFSAYSAAMVVKMAGSTKFTKLVTKG